MKFIIVFLTSVLVSIAAGLPQPYYKIKDTQQMKKYFFTYIDHLAKMENKKILEERALIKKFFKSPNNLTKYEKQNLLLIQKRYKLNPKDALETYLYYVDIIPPSLVLAQAAVESGWGKSRFVKQANNIFGQWTWSGKGLVPNSRDSGKKHKIKIFDSLQSSVRGYMINLNVGWGYKNFRDLRNHLRISKAPISGIVLSKTLINYSQKKEKYTKLLAKIIKQNNLAKYDL
jgi:Bax protein